MGLEIEIKERGAETVVMALRGEMGILGASYFKKVIRNLTRGGKNRIILLLDGLRRLDCTGLGALVEGLKIAREKNGGLDLVLSKSEAKKIPCLTELSRSFRVFRSEREASRIVNRRPENEMEKKDVRRKTAVEKTSL